jgi:hypothetical protein
MKNLIEIPANERRIVTGSIAEMLGWLDSHPNTGAKFVSLHACNLMTADNGKLTAAARTDFPDGIVRETYRSYSIGISYANALNKGRLNEVLELAQGMNIDPATVELDYVIPGEIWKGAGKRYIHSHHCLIHVGKPHGTGTGRLYIWASPRVNPNGDMTAYKGFWQNAKTGEILTDADVQDFVPASERGTTTVEVAGVTTQVKRPYYRAQGLEGVQAIVYDNTIFKVNDWTGAVVPIPPE